MGGGTSRFELIQKFTIDEPISNYEINFDGYDELYILLEGVKGTNNASLVYHFTVGNQTNYPSQSNFFSDTTAKTIAIELNRKTESDFLRNYYGALSSNSRVSVSNIDSYDSKITKLKVGTTSTAQMTEGTIKIYGRNLTNE